MTIQEELTQLTDLIKSPTFHILPESAQQPTLAKQREILKLVASVPNRMTYCSCHIR